MPATITKDTLVPVGAICALLGGVFWLATMFATVNDTQRRVAKLEEKVDVVYDRTARIEAMLQTLTGKDLSYGVSQEAY